MTTNAAWPAGPCVSFKYQGKEASVHASVLESSLPYFHRAITHPGATDSDIGFINFHPSSSQKIIDLPWAAFQALVQWAYNGSLDPLFRYNNDATYWSAVALIIGVDALSHDLKQYDRWARLRRVGEFLHGLNWQSAYSSLASAGNTAISIARWFVIMLSFMVYGVLVLTALLTVVFMLRQEFDPEDLAQKTYNVFAIVVKRFVWHARMAYCHTALYGPQVLDDNTREFCHKTLKEDLASEYSEEGFEDDSRSGRFCWSMTMGPPGSRLLE